MSVLVTGGAGFVGSHVAVALGSAGHDVVIVDDGSNSDIASVVERVSSLLESPPGAARFDVRDTDRLVDLMVRHKVDAVVHLAAMKDLRESVTRPLDYYRNNLQGLRSVIDACQRVGVDRLVFSSSGSIYGDADRLPIDESAPIRPTNPYSASKAIGERMLARVCDADPSWSVMSLRYFNPAGAHPSALIGEASIRRSTNLLPVLLEAAAGERASVDVFGDDFDTPDGTGVRDYVHVMDVADAHVAALARVESINGFDAVNIGRGEGVSVLQLIDVVEQTTGLPVPYVRRQCRPGDVAALVGCNVRATQILGALRYRSVESMVLDAWRWHRRDVREPLRRASPRRAS